MASMTTSIHYCAGAEPYRALGIHVNEKPCVSAAELQVVKGCQKKFWEVLQKVCRSKGFHTVQRDKNGLLLNSCLRSFTQCSP